MESSSRWDFKEKEKDMLIRTLQPELPMLRMKADISQGELANIIGVSRQTYGALERGFRSMTWNTFLSLVLFFSCNQQTRKILESLETIPRQLMEKFNPGERTKQIDFMQFLGKNGDLVSDELDAQAIHAIETVIMVEYARCNQMTSDAVIKAFEGKYLRQESEQTWAARKALAAIENSQKAEKCHERKSSC